METTTLGETYSFWYAIVPMILYSVKEFYNFRTKFNLKQEVNAQTTYSKMQINKSNSILDLISKTGSNLTYASSMDFIEAVLKTSAAELIKLNMAIVSDNNLNAKGVRENVRRKLHDKLDFLYHRDVTILKAVRYNGTKLDGYHYEIDIKEFEDRMCDILFSNQIATTKKRMQVYQEINNQFEAYISNAKTFFTENK